MNVTENDKKHSVFWEMFMSVTLESLVFMESELLRQLAFHQEHRRSHNETDVRHV